MTETGSAIPCRTCGCLIVFSENNVSRNGIPIPINFNDNKYGGRGTNHNCRPKYEAPDPSKIDMHIFCNSCMTYHDRRIYPNCPCCWKLQCRDCKNKWVANVFNIKAVDDEGIVYRECIECGSMDVDLVEDIESWRKAWDSREEMVGLLKCPRCKGKNWIGPAPLYYVKSTNSVIVSFVKDLPYRDWWKT